jgi:hypothetical protein
MHYLESTEWDGRSQAVLSVVVGTKTVDDQWPMDRIAIVVERKT